LIHRRFIGVGYDDVQNLRDEELSVGQKKLVRKAEPPSKRGIRWPRWTGFRGMTVRDWLDLLVVPLALVVISLLFATQQEQRQQQIENQRAEAERELAVQRAQDEALQAYLDQMSTLLLERDLRNSEEDSEERTLARARTLTVLGRLDPSRKTAVMQFLEEARLVREVDGREPVIALTGADLSGAHLRWANLTGAYLGEANLSGAQLDDANLERADLNRANLSGANLKFARMEDALPYRADLSGADLKEAYLRGAYLSGADLSGAYLKGAYLSHADLSGADLSGARGVTNVDLELQASLKGATMPNGQKYEEWLKSTGREEDEQNDGATATATATASP
jgi:uncharacterized protein YjbI with pentapeptide repeats